MQLIHGDCLEVMTTIDAESVDAIITDPPYGLSFMGKDWDYGIPGEAFWREALRVAKPGAHLLAFGGSRTYHRLACAIEDAGWKIRDCIMWVYGSGFPKSHDVSKAIDKATGTDAAKQWHGWGTALKPAYEPIIVARKPLVGTVAANVQQFGTGAINIDGCRIQGGGASGLKPYTRHTSPEDHPAGRWPANLIHDGSDEVVALFPVTAPSPSKVTRGSTSSKHGSSNRSGVLQEYPCHGDSGSAARFFYTAKASKRDRDEGCEGFGTQLAGVLNMRSDTHAQATGNVYAPKHNPHPTVKPTDLMRYLCRLVTPPNGIVLDPFMGSGSTGKAAILEGFKFIGIEQNQEYIEIAQARIAHAHQKVSEKLFAQIV
jgi:site-specific DNA-methyltransferase (adenine-specific)